MSVLDESPPVLDPSQDSPPPPVRLNRLFVGIDRWLATMDGRIGRWLPAELNPLARSGAAANVALIVAVASGVLMLIWYSPSIWFAYPSLESLTGHTLGGWVRTLHRYSSDLTMLLLFVHAGRAFFARKFAGSRWLPWLTGVLMMALIWFIGWTGYWLIWDQPAQQVAISSMHLLDALPIFGEPMGRLFVADRLVPSLLFFVVFFLHMLLPLGITIGLGIHLIRVSRAKLLPRWELSAALVAALAVASLLLPAPIDSPADMAVKAPSFTVDAWYLSPLALSLRFQSAGLWVALFGTTALAMIIPWLLGKKRSPAAFVAMVDQSRCHSCSQCSQDCPFDAITLIPRTDGKRFTSQASVNPAKCVGCGVCVGSCDSDGIYVPWFEPLSNENRIAEQVATAMASGSSPWVAFVCGDIDGGVRLFTESKWSNLLEGYQVSVVPNASSVRPKFIERLLRNGVSGVLVVRDSRVEPWSRDGGRWVSDRLEGVRSPLYRPDRAGSGAWQVVDFDPSSPGTLAEQAAEFQATPRSGVVGARPSRIRTWVAAAVVVSTATLLAVGPSHLKVTNPAPDHPEFIFSFKVLGDWVEQEVDPATEAEKPIHMRGRSTEKPVRSDVAVRLDIGGTISERSFEAKGISNDGPAIDEWRLPLEPGTHPVTIEIRTGTDSEPLRWTGTIEAEPRRYLVVTYDPSSGFLLE